MSDGDYTAGYHNFEAWAENMVERGKSCGGALPAVDYYGTALADQSSVACLYVS